MYLRRHRSGSGQQVYEYWTLVKSVRRACGPRQEIVATLGKLPGLDQQVRASWEEVEALLRLREPLYRECANLAVNTVGRAPDEIAAEIQAHLEGRRSNR